MVDFRPLLFANALVLMLLVAAGFASLQAGNTDLTRFGLFLESLLAPADHQADRSLEPIQAPQDLADSSTADRTEAQPGTDPVATPVEAATRGLPEPVTPIQPRQQTEPSPFEEPQPERAELAEAPAADTGPDLASLEAPGPLLEVELPIPAEENPSARAAATEAAQTEAPEPEPVATVAALTVRSNVYGDEVTVNGEAMGSTRLDLELEPDTYRIVVDKDGYQTWQTSIRLEAGDQRRIYAELEPFRTVHYRDGHWRGGVVSGEGSYVDETGLRYEGEFEDRQFHGTGRAQYPDGRRYDGEWEDGQPEGRGTLRLPGGDIYSGEFSAGVYSGEGTLTTDSGDIYSGNWARGQLNGQGTLTADDGTLYVGAFRNGEFHGEGTLTYPDGRYYEGGFAEGEYHGKGTLIFANGKKYEGHFMEGEYHGQGDLYNPNGSRITANFRYGEPYGQVRLTTAEGEVFTARTSEPGVCYRENSYRATQCPPMPGW